MGRYDILFEPVKIGPVTAPNRFYAVPHATGHGWSQAKGSCALRATKAEGGWGTVCSQMTEIAPDADMANHPMDRIWGDDDIAAHARQVEAVKAHGALAGIEIAHGGMRARNFLSGLPVAGPSDLPILRPEPPVQARAMDKADIRAFRENHKAAARRAAKAGFDIIYVYAAHDLSLLNHFLSVRTNQRNDEYGGTFENRLRLMREVLEDTLDVAAGKQAVALRFSVAEPGKAMGLTHDGEGRDVVEALAELPDLWDMNLSGWPADSQTSRFSDEGFQLGFTDFVKSVTTKPVVGVGRFTSPDFMVSMIKKGRLDLIGAARPSIADPFLPNKIREDRVEDVRECIGCNICVSMDGYGVPIRCTQNPTISEEWRRDWHPEVITGDAPKGNHMIIGAGPAGLECAWTLIRAGHTVTIADAAEEAGGRVTKESRLPGLNAWGRVRDYRLYQLSQRAEADLYLSSSMTAADLGDFGADSITIATGAHWRVDGVGSTNMSPFGFGTTPVFTPDDVMDGKLEGLNAQRVLVYDDDHFYMASVMAEYAATAGHQVTYACPLPTVATWTDMTLEQGKIIGQMNGHGTEILVNTALGNDCRLASTLTGKDIDVSFDAIIFVGARLPDNNLYQEALTTPDLPPVYRMGDCDTPGTIQAAVLSGHTQARRLINTDFRADVFRRNVSS
ncbi:MAG: NAD(P)-binding protein [Pikeienuella sp.]